MAITSSVKIAPRWKRDFLPAKVRTILSHPAYKRIFPNTRLKVGANRKDHFHTTARGECLAASQSSAITGFGTHYLLIDDYQKADEALSPVQRETYCTSYKAGIRRFPKSSPRIGRLE